MKNFKNIHNFNSFINEKDGFDSVETKISGQIEAMDDQKKAQLKKELESFAAKLGLQPGDLADQKKVEAALEKKGGDIKESMVYKNLTKNLLESDNVNEGIKDWFKKVSAKAMQMFGLGGLVSGIVTLAVNAEMQNAVTNAADYSGATVNPGMAPVFGGIALAVGVAAVALGLNKANKEAEA
jgi:hypothetical protein